MDEVAEAAGVCKGTVYLYYSSKEDLLLTSVGGHIADFGEHLLALVDEAMDGVLTAERFRHVIADMLDRMIDLGSDETSRRVMRLLLTERTRLFNTARSQTELLIQARAKLAGLLRKAKRAGVIECGKPQEAAGAVLRLVMSAVVADEMLGKGDGSSRPKSSRSEIVDFALRALGLDIERK